MAQPLVVSTPQSGAATRFEGFASTTGDTTHQQIVDMEVALEICNNYVAIANFEQDKIEQSGAEGADVELRIKKLEALRMMFLHEMRSKVTRENIAWVREFNQLYGAELKNYYKNGVLPAVFAQA